MAISQPTGAEPAPLERPAKEGPWERGALERSTSPFSNVGQAWCAGAARYRAGLFMVPTWIAGNLGKPVSMPGQPTTGVGSDSAYGPLRPPKSLWFHRVGQGPATRQRPANSRKSFQTSNHVADWKKRFPWFSHGPSRNFRPFRSKQGGPRSRLGPRLQGNRSKFCTSRDEKPLWVALSRTQHLVA